MGKGRQRPAGALIAGYLCEHLAQASGRLSNKLRSHSTQGGGGWVVRPVPLGLCSRADPRGLNSPALRSAPGEGHGSLQPEKICKCVNKDQRVRGDGVRHEHLLHLVIPIEQFGKTCRVVESGQERDGPLKGRVKRVRRRDE